MHRKNYRSLLVIRENDRVGKIDETHRVNKFGMIDEPERLLFALPTPTPGLLIVLNELGAPLQDACLPCHNITCTLLRPDAASGRLCLCKGGQGRKDDKSKVGSTC